MKLALLASFEVAHKKLPWPWLAIDPTHERFACVKPNESIGTWAYAAGVVSEGPTFELPREMRLPTRPAPATGHRGVPKGIHGLAIAPGGEHVALTGITRDVGVVITLGPGGEARSSDVDALGFAGFVAHAITFDRSGQRLWVSLENGAETVLLLLLVKDHAVLGLVRSAPFPPPSLHELHVHPQDDAVLLLASCGQDGTFARVAGWAIDPAPVAIPSALDEDGLPAGFVGFSSDGARVHLVEDAALRTHAWPGLQELSSATLPDEFAASFSGVVMNDRIFVDGHDADEGDIDLVLEFDRSAIIAKLMTDPVPTGMWVGRLGTDALLTVASSGEPAQGSVVRLLPAS